MCLTDAFEQEHPVGEGNDENRGRTGFAIGPLCTCAHTQDGKEVRRCGAGAGRRAVQSAGASWRHTIHFRSAGTDPQTHTLPHDFGQEAKNCLANVGRVLKDSGMDYANVVSLQIYLVDIAQFQEVNSLYKEYFKSPFPSRTTVQVSKLSLGSHIEIAAIARK